MKHIFIVNPIAGKGTALLIAKNIEKVCIEEKIDYIIHYVSKEHNATNLARKYKHSKAIIFSVGGDGTLSYVLNGIVGTNNILGFIPAGSGNDFYRVLKCQEETFLTADIGKINNKYFINVACLGIDADVGNNLDVLRNKNIPPSQLYNVSLLYTFFKYKNKEITLKVDDVIKKGKFVMIAICNGQYYGGGYHIAPSAEINDGKFSVYYAEDLNKFTILNLIMELKNGKHEKNSNVNKIQTDRIIIETEKNEKFNVDGEIIEGKKFDIKIIKNAVKLYNNKDLIEKILNHK